MTNAVWKFRIPLEDQFSIVMPEGARVLYVATQLGEWEVPSLWAAVNTEARPKNRQFLLVGTGSGVHWRASYCGSFQLAGGQLVYHLFELPEIEP